MTPTHPRARRLGVSIVEILITVVLLAVGALAALGLQASALRASGTASNLQTLTRVAESELQFRRGIDRGGVALTDAGTCRVLVPDGTTCTVAIEPCAIVSGAVACTGVAANDATAHQVTVRTAGAGGRDVTLTTLVATVASAAGAPSGGGGNDGGAGGDNGGGDAGGGDAGGGDAGGGDAGGGDAGGGDAGGGDAGGGDAGGGGQEPQDPPPGNGGGNGGGNNGGGNGDNVACNPGKGKGNKNKCN